MSILDGVVEKDSFCYGNAKLENPVVIVYGEDGFEMPMGVSMTSVIRNHPDRNIMFHVFTEGSAANFSEHLKKLSALAAESANICIHVHVLDASALDSMPTTMAISKATYYRFLMDRFVGDVQFVIYMDCDIVCLRPMDFNMMYDAEAVISAVQDLPEVARESAGRLGLHSPYFNAGVLVINLPQWRARHIVFKAMAYLDQNPETTLMDQDALNAVLAAEGDGSVHYLPDGYNFEYDAPTAERIPMPDDVVLLHYIAEKPWYPWLDHPARHYFFDEKARSLWKDTPLPLPRNYTQRHRMALHCMKHHAWMNGLQWYLQYIVTKPLERCRKHGRRG